VPLRRRLELAQSNLKTPTPISSRNARIKTHLQKIDEKSQIRKVSTGLYVSAFSGTLDFEAGDWWPFLIDGRVCSNSMNFSKNRS
jgi:hypothetical protein